MHMDIDSVWGPGFWGKCLGLRGYRLRAWGIGFRAWGIGFGSEEVGLRA